jgi:hypothetical protein
METWEEQKRRHLITAGIVAAVAAVVLLILLPWSTRFSADEQICRLRLMRLGRAVTLWVIDHGHRFFPVITNPPPNTLWVPDRQGSASVILEDYLKGDIPRPQRENESAEAYIERLRSHELTVDPRTGQEFWYNSVWLDNTTPNQVASGEQSDIEYFRSQRGEDGSWPYRKSGEEGVYAVFGVGSQRQITEVDVAALEARLAELERQHEGLPPDRWTHDLLYLRKEVRRYRGLLHKGEADALGRKAFVRIGLTNEVRWIPLGPRD